MNCNAAAIAKQFQCEGKFKSAESFGAGHINDTYLITFEKDNRNIHFVLQHINKYVFKTPEHVMDNMCRVTEHIHAKLESKGTADIDRKCLAVIRSVDGKNYYRDEADEYWRCCSYITNGQTYDKAPAAKLVRAAAKEFALFGKMLIDLPGPALHETIADFHNGPKRFRDFEKALQADPQNRTKDVKPEIDFMRLLKNSPF